MVQHCTLSGAYRPLFVTISPRCCGVARVYAGYAHHSKGIEPPRHTPNPHSTTYTNSYIPMASASGSYFPQQQLSLQHPRLHLKRN